MKGALAIGLAALCAPAWAADPTANASAAARAATWLEGRTAAIHASPPDESGRLARATIQELRGRLEAEGLDPPLAVALSPVPGTGASTGREIHLLERAAKRLRAFARSSARPLPPVPAGARSEMERILQDPVFDLKPENAGHLARVTATLRRFLFEVVSSVVEAASSHARLVMALVVTIMAAALLLFVMKLVRALRSHEAAPVRPSHPSHAAGAIDPQALIAKAQESAAAGRGRAALKLLETASVLALRSRGDIPPDPGLTDLEAVGWLRQRGGSQIGASFERLSFLHDGIVYGGREAAGVVIEEAIVLARTLVAGVPEPAS